MTFVFLFGATGWMVVPISDIEKAEERSKSSEKIQEFCFVHVEFEIPSRFSNGEINTFEYINLDLWGVVRDVNKIWKLMT